MTIAKKKALKYFTCVLKRTLLSNFELRNLSWVSVLGHIEGLKYNNITSTVSNT